MANFLASSLSNLFNNLAKGFHKIKYKYDEKKIETCGVKYCFLEYTNFKANLTEYKCLCCNKNFQKKIDENLKKRFFNTYKFSNHDINKFILLLWKGVCPYLEKKVFIAT